MQLAQCVHVVPDVSAIGLATNRLMRGLPLSATGFYYAVLSCASGSIGNKFRCMPYLFDTHAPILIPALAFEVMHFH